MKLNVLGFSVFFAVLVTRADAQRTRADSLLLRGNVQAAESLYYAAARARPHDPAARWNLGTFLIARGATRIGMTLVEEAVRFGYDKRRAAAVLGPVYLQLGEYAALSGLTPPLLGPAERDRLRWLIAHPSRTVSSDSIATMTFARPTSEGWLGAVTIRINGRTMAAALSARAGCGLAITPAVARTGRVRTFGSDRSANASAPGVTDSLALGSLTLTNVPTAIETLSDGIGAMICLPLLARFLPAFDARMHRVALHVGIRPDMHAASTLNVFAMDDQLAVARPGGWVQLSSPEMLSTLADRRWIFDSRAGQIVVLP